MEPINCCNLAELRKKSICSDILSESHMNACFTCGTCSGGCPLTGMESSKDEGLDARKVIRMAAFGMDQAVIDSHFVWFCTGCQRCVKACPTGAITGPRSQAHNLDQDKCIKCRSCYEVCRFDAVAGDAIVVES